MSAIGNMPASIIVVGAHPIKNKQFINAYGMVVLNYCSDITAERRLLPHTYVRMYLATANTEAFAAPNVEHATISGMTTNPASSIVLYPNGYSQYKIYK